MKNYSIENYERPSVAADAVVFGIDTEKSTVRNRLDKKKLQVLLIKRGEEPFADQYALPGGFLRKGETIEETALRELKEEAGVADPKIILTNVYSESDRDPRGWIISVAFLALTKTVELSTEDNSDASEAVWFDFFYSENGDDSIITLIGGKLSISMRYRNGKFLPYSKDVSESVRIAFDHAQIIYDAYKKLQAEVVNNDIIFELMPDLFTISDLQQPYEAITGHKIAGAYFRRKMSSKIYETELYDGVAAHRTSKLYAKIVDRKEGDK